MRSASLRDVAAKAGVSVPTASLVLSGKADTVGINADTQKRVHAAAAELKYRPNSQAIRMRQKRFGHVLLLEAARSHTLNQHLVSNILARFDRDDITLSLAQLPDDVMASGERIPSVLRGRNADGILLNWTRSIPRSLEQYLDDTGIPHVWINNKRATDAVYPDDEAAAAHLGETLTRFGHRHVAWWIEDKPDTGHYSEIDREEGLRRAVNAAGGTLTVMRHPENPVRGEHTADERIPFARKFLKEHPEITAIVSYDKASTGPLLYAVAGSGRRIPDDISLAQYCPTLDQQSGIPIAHMNPNMSAVGTQVAEMMLAKINAPDTPVASVTIPHEFFPGTTISTPRR